MQVGVRVPGSRAARSVPGSGVVGRGSGVGGRGRGPGVGGRGSGVGGRGSGVGVGGRGSGVWGQGWGSGIGVGDRGSGVARHDMQGPVLVLVRVYPWRRWALAGRVGTPVYLLELVPSDSSSCVAALYVPRTYVITLSLVLVPTYPTGPIRAVEP